jgi:hypothetical protein
MRHPRGVASFLFGRLFLIKTFSDVMREFPYETLMEHLRHPHAIDKVTLGFIIDWTWPKIVQNEFEGTEAGIQPIRRPFVQRALESRIVSSKSEVRRKIKEGALYWNGVRVTDENMLTDFLEPGWAVVQLGKKHFKTLLKGWKYA